MIERATPPRTYDTGLRTTGLGLQVIGGSVPGFPDRTFLSNVIVLAITVSREPLKPTDTSAEGRPRLRTAPSGSLTISMTGRSPARIAARAASSPATPL